MTQKEFQTAVLNKIKTYPSDWREGQKVFNAAEEILWDLTNHTTNIARDVQFIDRTDCFYNDSLIDVFLAHCYIRLFQYQNQNNKTCDDTDDSEYINKLKSELPKNTITEVDFIQAKEIYNETKNYLKVLQFLAPKYPDVGKKALKLYFELYIDDRKY